MKTNKSACFIVQHYFPADIRVLKEAVALQSRGYTITIIALRDENEAGKEVKNGITIHRMKLRKNRGSTARYLYEYIAFFIYSFIKLNLLDIKKRFDVVHINTLPDFLVFAALIQKLQKRRIILDMHEIMPEFFISKFGVKVDSPVVTLLKFFEKISLRFADGVITVNEPIKRIFQQRAIPGKNVTVVMNTVDKDSVIKKPKKAHRGFNCVYHGTITDIYGLDTAVAGFAKACTHASDLFFNIYGSGQQVDNLKKLALDLKVNDKVIFHGQLPHGDMMDALANMDLGILASRKDIFLNLSFSNKLAEYVYLEIPVVSSDLEATQFYFNEDEIIFFEAGNIDYLAQKILFAYQNRERIKRMATKAIRRYAEYEWEIMAKRYIELVDGMTVTT